MIPVLMITYNRLDYTRQALPALLRCRGISTVVIDNGSMDGTVAWLHELEHEMWRAGATMPLTILYNADNRGVGGAMNQFLGMTTGNRFVGKVDNDTIVPADWMDIMVERMEHHKLDAMQAAHELLPAVFFGKTFEHWTALMPHPVGDPMVRFHHFVGGTGLVIRRRKIRTPLPQTEWKLYGWREFQRQTPGLKTAFCTATRVRLLDADGAGFNQYPEYYKETRRLP